MAKSRFAQLAAGNPRIPANTQSLRNMERSEVAKFNKNDVYLPNPMGDAPFDKRTPQSYEQKIYGLGLGPNIPQHFWQLIKGDSGAGSSVYRRAELFQLLAPTGDRTSETPYSKAIQIATMRSTDQRPRYFHASLFSVGRQIASAVPLEPLPENEIYRFAPGIPAGTASVSGSTQFGVPQFSNTQFRVMIHDESGQRFFDTDVLGTRSINAYAFGMTVFALIKEDGYEIDRQRDDNPALGPGLIDQSVVGARIIPIRTNETQNVDNRTVGIVTPMGPSDPVVVPIPPGARRVQGYLEPPAVGPQTAFFATVDPLDPAFAVIGTQGAIDIPTLASSTDIYDIPNSNAIVIVPSAGDPGHRYNFVFEVTP